MNKNEFVKHLQMTKLSNDINLNDLSNGAEKEVTWLKAALLFVLSRFSLFQTSKKQQVGK